MLQLTSEQCERAVGAYRAFIARTVSCSSVAVTNVMQRYRQTGQTSDRSRTSRPKLTTPRTDRSCVPCICGVASWRLEGYSMTSMRRSVFACIETINLICHWTSMILCVFYTLSMKLKVWFWYLTSLWPTLIVLSDVVWLSFYVFITLFFK